VRPALEVADIFRRHGDAFRAAQNSRLSPDQRRVPAAIEVCRTAALNGHVEQCDDCGLVRIAYNSYRDRHCPKCQGLARAQWVANRRADLLPVPYFHVVFTVPAPIATIALQNNAVVHDILLKTAAETIRLISADPRYLGAESGMIAVLHIWGQTLTHHPHVIVSCRAAASRRTGDGSAVGPTSSGKYNSPTRCRAEGAQRDLTLTTRNSSEICYACGGRLGFHAADISIALSQAGCLIPVKAASCRSQALAG
jgi:hypothetical protein